MRGRELQQNIRHVVDQVVGLANPLRVVLFGSAVTGTMGPDSDLDFLVVVPEGQRPEVVVDRLNSGLRPRPMPCDFLVVTPSMLRRNARIPGLVYGEILKHGREVYAA